MKRLLTSLCLLCGLLSAKAQRNGVFIEEFTISDQVIHGLIDDKYAITAYLKFEEYSPENWLSFSVSGWYYYDNVKKKIPLVGIYYGEGIVLYSFTDPLRSDSIRQMTSTASNNPWEITDELISRSGYSEKFELNYSEYHYRGSWKNDKKELAVTFNTGSIDLDKRYEFLVLPLTQNEKKHIALDQFGPFSYGYSVFASKSDISGFKVLLKYEMNSTGNPNGMCGAGMETGYMLLTFDSKGNLLEYRTQDVESCLRNTWSEIAEVPGSGGKRVIYTVTDSEEKVHTVTVDGINFTLVSK